MSLLQAPAEGFGQGRGAFNASFAFLGHLWCSVVTLVTLTKKIPQKNNKCQKKTKKKYGKKLEKNNTKQFKKKKKKLYWIAHKNIPKKLFHIPKS